MSQAGFERPQIHALDRTATKSKCKGLPRQAEVAQGVPGRLRPRIFLTFRQYKGGRSWAKGIGRLYPRRNPWYSLSEAESTSGHIILSGVPRKKSPVTPPGIDPGTVRLVAQCLNHYATPGPTSRPLGSANTARGVEKCIELPKTESWCGQNSTICGIYFK